MWKHLTVSGSLIWPVKAALLTLKNPTRLLRAIKAAWWVRAATGKRRVQMPLDSMQPPNTKRVPYSSAKRPPTTYPDQKYNISRVQGGAKWNRVGQANKTEWGKATKDLGGLVRALKDWAVKD